MIAMWPRYGLDLLYTLSTSSELVIGGLALARLRALMSGKSKPTN